MQDEDGDPWITGVRLWEAAIGALEEEMMLSCSFAAHLSRRTTSTLRHCLLACMKFDAYHNLVPVLGDESGKSEFFVQRKNTTTD
jgi:hypothetical protein